MKLRTLLTTTALVLSGIAWAGPNDADHKPMHGGVLTTVKDIDYELVASPTPLRLYVRDHGKAVDVSKASAKLTLLTRGASSCEKTTPRFPGSTRTTLRMG